MIAKLVRHAVSVFRRPQPPNELTLVIDDGPTDVTADLLRRLEKGGHRAVLFVLGCNMGGREGVLATAVRRGFALGNHSYLHERFSTIGAEEARTSILRTERLIDQIYAQARVRRPGKWFRFPFLDAGGEHLSDFQTLLRELGFERPLSVAPDVEESDRQRLDWPTTLLTKDWELPDEIDFRKRIRNARRGSVIEFHDKPETVRCYSRALVEELASLSLRATVPSVRQSNAVVGAVVR